MCVPVSELWSRKPEDELKFSGTFEKSSLFWHIILYFTPWSTFQVRGSSVQSFLKCMLDLGQIQLLLKSTEVSIDLNGSRGRRSCFFAKHPAVCLRALSRNRFRLHKNYSGACCRCCLLTTDALWLFVWKLKWSRMMYGSSHCWGEELLSDGSAGLQSIGYLFHQKMLAYVLNSMSLNQGNSSQISNKRYCLVLYSVSYIYTVYNGKTKISLTVVRFIIKVGFKYTFSPPQKAASSENSDAYSIQPSYSHQLWPRVRAGCFSGLCAGCRGRQQAVCRLFAASASSGLCFQNSGVGWARMGEEQWSWFLGHITITT